jgi:hypothetical protein
MSLSRFDSLRGITRRALWIDYRSPLICVLAEEISGSGSADVSTLDIQPVTRTAGTCYPSRLARPSFANLASIPDAYVYVVYRATAEAGPFSHAAGVQPFTWTPRRLHFVLLQGHGAGLR